MTGNYDHLWRDEKNWGGGWCGWYFCKEDPRLWVPKSNPKMGITVNLGHPKGGATLVAMFMLPVAFLVFGLVTSVAVSALTCGTNIQ